MKRCLLLLALLTAPWLLQAGFHFGLGKAAAKRSAETIKEARESPVGRALDAVSGGGSTSRIKWATPKGESIYYSSPALSSGTVYFGTSGHFVLYNAYWLQALKPPTTQYALYAYHSTGTLKWSYADDAPARGSPVIGSDGTIYMIFERMSNSKAATQEELHAITSSGTLKWKQMVSSGAYAEIGAMTPSLGADGTLYVSARDFSAYTSTGGLKWTYPGSQSNTSVFFGSPAIARDGTIYSVFWSTHGAFAQVVLAMNPDGTEKWRSAYNLGTYPASGSPSIASDGTVYIGFHDSNGSGQAGTLLALSSATGATRWTFSVDDFDARSQPSIDADGTIYFGTKGSNGYIYAVNPDGTQKWRYKTLNDANCACGVDIYNTPLIGAGGVIYVSNEFGYQYAFTQSGTLLWKEETGGSNWSSGALDSDGTLFTGSTGGKFMAIQTQSLGLSTTAQWSRFNYSNDNAGRQP